MISIPFEKSYNLENDTVEIKILSTLLGEFLVIVSINDADLKSARKKLIEFTNTVLLDILKEHDISIIRCRDISASSYGWSNIKYIAEYNNQIDVWKQKLKYITDKLYKCGIEKISDYTNFSRFDYDRLKLEYSTLLLDMMNLGYALDIKSQDDLLKEFESKNFEYKEE